MIPDIVNGCFEGSAALFQLINVVALYKDKEVKGVRALPIAFFSLWGVWNLYYYPSLSQIFSFIGGLGIVIVNLIWVILMIYYNRRNKI